MPPTPEAKLLAEHRPCEDHSWDGRERRTSNEILYDLLEKQNEKLEELAKNVSDYVAKLDDHIKGEEHFMKLIIDGFPNSDPAGHRHYHEAKIREAEERADLYRKLRFELTKWGLIGFIGWLVTVGWKAFLQGPK